MIRRHSPILAVCLTLVWCNFANSQETQYDDSRNPFYKQARQDLDNNNPAAAVADYEAALGANPKLAGAHYQLGVIYSDKLQDPIGSIFHFKRFLEMDPTSDQAAKVKDLIAQQSQAYVASLPNTATQTSAEITRLQADNASLVKQVADAATTIRLLQDALARRIPVAPAPVAAAPVPATSAPAAPSPPPVTDSAAAAPTGPPRALPLDSTNFLANATAPPPAAAAGPSRTYTVVKGDSLWKISHKMYPHDTKNGVDKIQDANKDAIGNKPLKIGQVLIIP